MIKVKQSVATILKGIIAGGCIGIGGYLYLIAGSYNKILGAILFALGLSLILNFGYFLYTGKICFLFNYFKKTDNLPYYLQLIFGLIGNYIGATIVGLVFSLFSGLFKEGSIINISQMVTTKLSTPWYIVILLAIGCNIMIYFAVDGFNKINNDLGKYIILFGSIAGFIIMGFEHCVADMFYLAYAREFSLSSFGFLGLVIIGNTIGGLLIPSIVKIIKLLEKRN